MFGVVPLHEARRPLVLRRDRPDLHFYDAAVLVALDLLEFRSGHAGRNALEVREHRPRYIDGNRYPKIILQLHR